MPRDEDFSLKSFFFPLTNLKAITFIVGLGIIVYANMLFNAFVADDITLILLNPTVQSFANIPMLLFQSHSNASGGGLATGSYYIPLTTIFFALLYSTFGAISFFFHAFQLSIHIFNACIVFFIFTFYFSRRLSLFLALIFVVHPITQETVAYIANLQDVLYFFFGSLAFLLYKKLSNQTISTRNLLLIFALILLSLLSKITGILFVLLILFDCFTKQRKLLLPIGIASGSMFGIYLLMKHFATIVPFQVGVSALAMSDATTRLITIPKIASYYISTFFFPQNLITHQDWIVKTITMPNFYLPLFIDILLCIGLVCLGIFSFKKSKKQFHTFLFFAWWFLIGLLLHIQIIPLDFTVADRWFYFPLVGLLGLLGVFISFLPKKRNTAIIVGLVIIALLSVRTIVRNNDWRNGYTLYRHDIVLEKDNMYLNGLLGNEYMTMGNYDEALKYFFIAAKQNPLQWKNYINIGAAYYSKGDKEKAALYFQKAIDVGKPQMGYERLGKLYILDNKLDKAQKTLQEGVKIYPNSEILWQLLAITKDKLGER